MVTFIHSKKTKTTKPQQQTNKQKTKMKQRVRLTDVASSLSFSFGADPRMWNGASHLQDGPSNLGYLNFKTSLIDIPTVRPNLDNPSLRLPFWAIPDPAKLAIKMNHYDLQADFNHQIITPYSVTSFPSRPNKILSKSTLIRGGWFGSQLEDAAGHSRKVWQWQGGVAGDSVSLSGSRNQWTQMLSLIGLVSLSQCVFSTGSSAMWWWCPDPGWGFPSL